jgi:hypothetical protein
MKTSSWEPSVTTGLIFTRGFEAMRGLKTTTRKALVMATKTKATDFSVAFFSSDKSS